MHLQTETIGTAMVTKKHVDVRAAVALPAAWTNVLTCNTLGCVA